MNTITNVFKNVSYLFKTSWKMFKGIYFFEVFNCIFSTAMPFINLYFPKWILDELSAGRNWEKIIYLIVLWGGISGVIALINNVIAIFSNVYWDQCTNKDRLIWANINADMEYSKLEDGAVIDEKKRIASNINFANFPHKLMNMISIIIQLVGYAYIIVNVHPFIVVFIFAIIFFNSVITKKANDISYEYEKIMPKYNRMFDYLFKTLISFSYAKEIRINNAFDLIKDRYKENEKAYMKTYKKRLKKNFETGIFSNITEIVQTIVLYGYSAYKAAIRHITMGDFTIIAGAASSFISSFGSMVRQVIEIKKNSDYVDAYKAFMDDVMPKEPKDCVKKINKEAPEIEFVDVSFKYPNCENYVLKNISVKIKSGERLCIVGYNGAGKTTLIKLICKLYQPTEGKILFNGTDISKIRNEDYMPLLSVIFQDFKIYSLPFWENICLDEALDERKFNDAVRLCGLSDKIAELPYGIETQITKEYDEEGVEFSGGEGQKLATARAYYKDSPLVILDEPTASLDPIAESNLYKRFDAIIGHKTAIYISHRLASVKFCDKVLVMEDGKINGYGTHKELMKNNRSYFEMYSKQSEYYNETETDLR